MRRNLQLRRARRRRSRRRRLRIDELWLLRLYLRLQRYHADRAIGLDYLYGVSGIKRPIEKR